LPHDKQARVTLVGYPGVNGDYHRAPQIRPRVYFTGTDDVPGPQGDPNDCAVLYLDQPLPAGVKLQPFGIDPGNACIADDKLQAIGFSTEVGDGFKLLHDPTCRNHREVSGEKGTWRGDARFLYTDCSLSRNGASGSPPLC